MVPYSSIAAINFLVIATTCYNAFSNLQPCITAGTVLPHNRSEKLDLPTYWSEITVFQITKILIIINLDKYWLHLNRVSLDSLDMPCYSLAAAQTDPVAGKESNSHCEERGLHIKIFPNPSCRMIVNSFYDYKVPKIIPGLLFTYWVRSIGTIILNLCNDWDWEYQLQSFRTTTRSVICYILHGGFLKWKYLLNPN